MSKHDPLRVVISGAQIGADIAGLRAAHACDLKTGGWMPLGYKTRDGRLPPHLIALYNLQQTDVSTYPKRTEMNVIASTGTVRFAYNFDSPGEKCTLKFLKKHNRPYLDVPLYRQEDGKWAVSHHSPWLADWIIRGNIHTLNVAGNANRLIEDIVAQYLRYTFAYLEAGNAARAELLVR